MPQRHAMDYRKQSAFTIVELLVVIVVIGILAAITIVSYTGISNKATVASLQSDLSNAKKQLALYYVDHGAYPVSIDDSTKCPKDSVGTADTRYCLKPSTGNASSYYPTSATYSTYLLTANKTNTTTIYSVTNDTGPAIVPTVTIGSQTWMSNNLNVGVRISGGAGSNQTNNSIIEKYCYDDTDAGCTNIEPSQGGIAYGGLYQWAEAVQYQNGATNSAVTNPALTGNVQGICPAGFHIPTDTEYKTLEMQLGMSQAQADLADAWRGTIEGTKLKSGVNGTSGLNVPLAGFRGTGGTFHFLSSFAYLWSSSESSTSAWLRFLYLGFATVGRSSDGKGNGFSVRCLGN